MRPLLLSILTATLAGTLASAACAQPDSFWQRSAQLAPHPVLKPFRTPKGVDMNLVPKGQLPRYWSHLERLHGLRKGTKSKVRSDRTGREIVDDRAWRKTLEDVQKASYKLEGHVAYVLRDSGAISQRSNAAYGFFYFADVQQVFHFISQIAAEPNERIRRDAEGRALKFLARHLPESKPLNEKLPDGLLVPKYALNPYGFFELAKRKEPHLAAEGLKFLADVLAIRPDLGRVYLEQLRDPMPGLLKSEAELVRRRAIELIGNVVRAMPKSDGQRLDVPGLKALHSELDGWWKQVDYALFPPIRHVSSGLTLIHPSEERDRLVKVGRELLAKKDAIGTSADGKLKTGQYYRGFSVQRLPEPLDKLGIPKGAVVTNVQNTPVFDSTMALKEIETVVARHAAALERHEKYLEKFKKEAKLNQKPRPGPRLAFSLQYVHQGKVYWKDFVWL